MPISLKEVGVPKEDLKSLAEYIVNERQYLYNLGAFNPRKLTLENVKQLRKNVGRKNRKEVNCFWRKTSQLNSVIKK